MKRLMIVLMVVQIAVAGGCVMETVQMVAEGVNLAFGGEPMSSNSYASTSSAHRYPTLEETAASYNGSGMHSSTSHSRSQSLVQDSSPTVNPRPTQRGSSSEVHVPDVNKPSTIAVTWETESGKWGAAGPTQFGWLSEKTEKIAIEFVYDESRYSLSYIGRRGKFKIYRVSQPWSAANKDIRRWLKEKHGVDTSDIP